MHLFHNMRSGWICSLSLSFSHSLISSHFYQCESSFCYSSQRFNILVKIITCNVNLNTQLYRTHRLLLWLLSFGRCCWTISFCFSFFCFFLLLLFWIVVGAHDDDCYCIYMRERERVFHFLLHASLSLRQKPPYSLIYS